jgi:penicillin-binding protein 2
MLEVRNSEQELAQVRMRMLVAVLGVMTLFGLLAARFVYLQVYKASEFTAQAEENRIAVVPVPPSRGLIYDRNGVLIAENVSEYTLEVNPTRIADLEQTISDINGVIEITPKDRRRFKKLIEESKTLGYLPLKTRLTDEEVAKFAAFKFRYPGVEVRARLFRKYPFGETGSHMLGYIGRISPAEEEAINESDDASNYSGTTHIGKIGLEQSYEAVLHGKTGSEEIEVSAGGRAVRSLAKQQPKPGSNLHLSVDIKLQKLIEELYGDRKGALVAIEPATGDILAFVSKPTYDPNAFTDGIDPQAWAALNESPDKPLLNRPLRGTYPPGSTYKPFMALAALETGARVPSDGINDPGYFAFGGRRFRDSRPGGNGYVDLHKSIVVSSDTYYYILARDMGVDAIAEFMKPFSFGQLTGIDMKAEDRGVLPSTEWKMKRYKQKWLPGETISVGIGQGYNNYTMLQLAHATAVLAARGKVMKPHLVKAIEDPQTKEKRDTVKAPSYTIALKEANIDFVHKAMIDVSKSGTSRIAMANTPYLVAGKTGTAQVIAIKQNERYDAKKIAEKFRDHSLFMAFAPADNPKIALALIVENGGFGAQAAAPIARKALDYYLLGKLPDDIAVKDLPSNLSEDELRDMPENTDGEQEAEAQQPGGAPTQTPSPPSPSPAITNPTPTNPDRGRRP